MNLLDKSPYYIEVNTKLAPFWEGLNQGEFKTTKCNSCNAIHYPPRVMCPKCYSNNLTWIELPGSGVIESFTHVQIPPPGFNGKFYLVAVNMDELGKTILGRYISEDEPQIGQKVTMSFDQMGDQAVYIFKSS